MGFRDSIERIAEFERLERAAHIAGLKEALEIALGMPRRLTPEGEAGEWTAMPLMRDASPQEIAAAISARIIELEGKQ